MSSTRRPVPVLVEVDQPRQDGSRRIHLFELSDLSDPFHRAGTKPLKCCTYQYYCIPVPCPICRSVYLIGCSPYVPSSTK
ncbi:uncharacterized protein L3040_000019 [Drepanopeziza brunnea f. sp. 'multigermtubi']|uniref:uncharacterized protein n=1 Tax=Drepanopeziza brunnea f. sp. 'multigermtubi' TaxID=698441 RepID=UPI002398C7AC|nr:hypothetical protein L3040_000019 [Drepanopeziza brunnea f. sp. 'multigermtubi']